MKFDTTFTLMILAFLLICLTSCDLNPIIPDPPEPSEIHHEQVTSVTWNTAYRVTYSYACTAGDARLVATLTYNRNQWEVKETWIPEICPMR